MERIYSRHLAIQTPVLNPKDPYTPKYLPSDREDVGCEFINNKIVWLMISKSVFYVGGFLQTL